MIYIPQAVHEKPVALRDPRSSSKSLGRVQRAAAGVKVEQNIIEQRQLVVMRHGSVANGLVQLLERIFRLGGIYLG